MFHQQWFPPTYLTPSYVLFGKSCLSLSKLYRAQLLTEELEYMLKEAHGFASQGGFYLVIEFYLEIT